jgi:hypothetical protein
LDWAINTHQTQTQEKKKNNSGRSEWDIDTIPHRPKLSIEHTLDRLLNTHKPVTPLHRQQPGNRVVKTKTLSSPLALSLLTLSHTKVG